MTDKIYTAGLIVIGDEILSGRTHDKNIAQVASWLQVQNIRLDEVRVVPDVQERTELFFDHTARAREQIQLRQSACSSLSLVALLTAMKRAAKSLSGRLPRSF